MDYNSQKHAYCIMAHDDMECLQTLVRSLDHPNNSIFLHIDRKAKNIKESGINIHKATLHIVPKAERVDVRWGGLSQVKAELLLFKTALNSSNFSYLHLLSGADLPLKTQEEVHSFFQKLPKGSNIVTFSHGEHIKKNVEFKTRYYHPFVEFQRFRNDGNIFHFIQDFSAKAVRNIFVNIQKIIGYKRKWKSLELKKGSQWVSLSPDFASYLVGNDKKILKIFKGVICPDEIFVHTMIYNSPFKDTVWDYQNKKSPDIRKIDWQRGTPYTWQKKDFKELIESGSFFARKFSSKIDSEIIKMIGNHLNPAKSSE